jgi:3D (Asp-Asp-Asp) domain-containing protein
MTNLISYGKRAIINLMIAVVIVTGSSLLGVIINKMNREEAVSATAAIIALPIKKINMIITAYSSDPEETDDTPFTTASGKFVRDGIVANNYLPFGTKIRLPELYGDKIFEVEDRMNCRKSKYHIDIWFPSHSDAESFGVTRTDVEIIEG